ncbi:MULTISPECIES: DUF881 domain-containing protein [unclassified Nocardioides]|uniref:DUF881 domain-containing protein n=1 Tax=unclassified Nocardioides TaxID=2615069 RepID=UPI003014B70C
MTSEHPHAGTSRWRRLLRFRGPWTLGTPVVVLLCGSLFVVSAQNSDGTDLRPGRYTDLADLVRAESDRYQRLQDRVSDLTEDVTALTESVNDRSVNRYRRQIARFEDPAGLVERSGEGLTITLTDSPEELVEQATATGGRLSNYVVHQQDIQAVVNALWTGGAEAVTVMGKRIVSTTGIKCIGNSVFLQGRPYSPPYVISAVGDQDALLSSVADDTNLQTYRQQADDPEIAIGWELEVEDDVTAPAYDGLLDLSYAEPME